MRRMTIAAIAVLTLGALMASGCTRVRLQDRPDTRTFTETKEVPLDGAKQLEAQIVQGVGELRIHGEASSTTRTAGTFKGTFTFAPESWRPEVTSTTSSDTVSLTVKQPQGSSVPAFHDAKNSWALVFPAAVPTKLDLMLGVGTSNLDLTAIDVTGLDVLTGVGDSTIDLSGARTHDVMARIEAGVGRLTLVLPRDVGARVKGREEGVGHVSAEGFIASGDSWVSSAYSGGGPKIEIDLVRGVGDVTLELR